MTALVCASNDVLTVSLVDIFKGILLYISLGEYSFRVSCETWLIWFCLCFLLTSDWGLKVPVLSIHLT